MGAEIGTEIIEKAIRFKIDDNYFIYDGEQIYESISNRDEGEKVRDKRPSIEDCGVSFPSDKALS